MTKIRIKNILGGLFIAITLMASLYILDLALSDIMGIWYTDDTDEQTEEMSFEEESEPEENCNVTGLSVVGYLTTYIPNTDYNDEGYITEDETSSDEIMQYIRDAEKDNKIKAILIEVDSYGGQAVAGEEIANAIKSSTKPTIAVIRSAGASAAYWAATGANIIYASKNSDVGGIGVTMSYLDYTKYNEKEGLTYNQLSTGKFKDSGDPDKPLTLEEKKLFERDLNIMFNNFIQAVSENRKLSIDKVKKLADGSTVLGEMALKNGLIDKIGGPIEVRNYLKEKLNEEISVCWE